MLLSVVGHAHQRVNGSTRDRADRKLRWVTHDERPGSPGVSDEKGRQPPILLLGKQLRKYPLLSNVSGR